ncbi:DinB family protein [Flammeovirgaceae bacterium SG7u.111]|nr:DinB family protein [Flammeovirgaceae bacterium SG7u.132]WPO35002.1 DinB family protein [Flammeovirgaceae bacterium SG7u.111]
MNIKTEILIEDLIKRTMQNLNKAEQLCQLSVEKLNWKSNPKKWNALECIEHLNIYGAYYLPEISLQIAQTPHKTPEAYFKSRWLGNYFANMLSAKENVKKMKTLKENDPIGSKLDKTVIEQFIDQQKRLLDLLGRARKVSLNKTITGMSITKYLTLKLGDTFRIVIYHNQRHIAQAFQMLSEYEESAKKPEVV